MDPISQARLDSLRVQDANTLTEADAAFLRARSSYLSANDKEKFADLLQAPAPVEEAAAEPAAPKAKK